MPGVPVLLLDIVPKDGANRNAIAEGAVAKMLKTDPAPFMGKRAAGLVETGNIEDHLGRVAECDWVVEAIIERLDIKQNLYAKLEEVRRPGTAVSSNTSTIPLAQLTDGRSDQFKQRFPHHPLLQSAALHAADRDRGGAAERSGHGDRWSRDFVDRQLGKSVVDAEDSPGFIANRIGTFWIQAAVNAAFDLGLSVEEADEIVGKPMGVPKTGVFGLVDLVGIDLMPHLMASLTSTLPKDDPYQAIARQRTADRSDDRRRLYRAQGQGRVLPHGQSRRWLAGQGGEGPQDRRISRCLNCHQCPWRCRQRRSEGTDGSQGQGRRLRLGRAWPDALLCRLHRARSDQHRGRRR